MFMSSGITGISLALSIFLHLHLKGKRLAAMTVEDDTKEELDVEPVFTIGSQRPKHMLYAHENEKKTTM